MQKTREKIHSRTIMGVDDWFAYIQDEEGRWFYLNTELSPYWADITPFLHETQGGVFLVAITALSASPDLPLTPITDPDMTKSLTESFGDS